MNREVTVATTVLIRDVFVDGVRKGAEVLLDGKLYPGYGKCFNAIQPHTALDLALDAQAGIASETLTACTINVP